MSDYRCPNCKSSGASQKICKTCNTTFCTSCKKTAQGTPVTNTSTTNVCPVCKKINDIYYVDYLNGRKV